MRNTRPRAGGRAVLPLVRKSGDDAPAAPMRIPAGPPHRAAGGADVGLHVWQGVGPSARQIAPQGRLVFTDSIDGDF